MIGGDHLDVRRQVPPQAPADHLKLHRLDVFSHHFHGLPGRPLGPNPQKLLHQVGGHVLRERAARIVQRPLDRQTRVVETQTLQPIPGPQPAPQ